MFLQAVGLDVDTEDRARGWALWKALITYAAEDKESESAREAKRVIDVLLKE